MKRSITKSVIPIVILISTVSFGSPDLSGQYWFGSLSVNADGSNPLGKRGTVSITGDQWIQQWEDRDGDHEFSWAFTTATQPDGSININFLDDVNLPSEPYNVAFNGDVMIHTGIVLGGGLERIDIFTRKAANVDVNDILGDHRFLGHYLGQNDDTALWGNFRFDPNGTFIPSWTDDSGRTGSDKLNWTLDDVNAVIDILAPMGDVFGHVELLLGKGDIGSTYHIVFEEGRDRNDLGYNILIKKTDQVITTADIAGIYQVRFLQTGPGGFPYTCRQGTCVIEALDDANGIMSMDAYYSNGEHDVSFIEFTVGPGNEFHIDDDGVPDGVISSGKNLIVIPENRYKNTPALTPGDWIGGTFLIRIPNNIIDPNTNGDWIQLSSMRTARDQFAGGIVGDEIFVFGGNGPDGSLYSGEKYDPITDTWSDIADNPHNNLGVEEITGIGCNGKFYVFGALGYDEPKETPGVLNYNQMYDPFTNTWKALAKKPTKTRVATPVVYEGKIYLFGGMDEEYFHTEVESYDPQLDTWLHVTHMPKTLYGMAIAVHSNCAYLIGGYDEGKDEINHEVIAYNFETGKWEQSYCTVPTDLPWWYSHATQTQILNGKVYLIGGAEGDGPENWWASNRFTIFDIESRSWLSGPALPESRSDPLTVVSNNTIYVIGGEDDLENPKDTVFAYTLPVSPEP